MALFLVHFLSLFLLRIFVRHIGSYQKQIRGLQDFAEYRYVN